MTFLLDSHAIFWWWTEPDRLSAKAVAAMANPDHVLFVSAASACEILYKAEIGKLPLPAPVRKDFSAAVKLEGWQSLPISLAHADRASTDSAEHRDPFDRLLAAQSRAENAPIITCDPFLRTFHNVKTYW